MVDEKGYFDGNREYRSDLFSMLLNEKEYALDVYNAVNDSDYDDPEEIEIISLESSQIYPFLKTFKSQHTHLLFFSLRATPFIVRFGLSVPVQIFLYIIVSNNTIRPENIFIKC